MHTFPILAVKTCLLAGALVGTHIPASARQAPAGVTFSTYLGGSGVTGAAAVSIDVQGNVYVSGTTGSQDLPTRNALHPYRGGPLGADAFVAGFSPSGELIFSTHLGGTGDDFATAMTTGEGGRVFVAGGTASFDFPATPNALQSYLGGNFLETDGFLVRLSPDGSSIEYATYLGGTGDDVITAVAVDPGGDVLLAGTTTSDDFPATAGVFQPARGGDFSDRPDAFVARLRPDGNGGYELAYATYLGGSGEDFPAGVATDLSGGAWIAGFTNSRDFPVVNPILDEFGGPLRAGEGDAFIARISQSGASLDFSTYLGGALDDQATGIAVDADDNVYVTGWSASIDFHTTPGAYQVERRGFRDRFVMKLVPAAGSWAPEYTTLAGSPGFDTGRAGIAVDDAGRVWIAGATTSAGFPAVNGGASSYSGGETDGFLARIDAEGRRLEYASFLGGSGADAVTGIALSGNTLCLGGSTGSADFPVRNAAQATLNGPAASGPLMTSAFVTCFDLHLTIDAEPTTDLPAAFALYPNYPNPFNPQTVIRFDVKTPSHVKLTVYDLLGRRQAILASEEFPAGRHEVSFDGRRLASGVYFYVIEMGDFRAVRKMLLLR